MRSASQEKNAQQVESASKLTAIIKDNIDGDKYLENEILRKPRRKYIPRQLKTTDLHKHQRRGINWLQESWNKGRRGVLLADDMGLGKTLQALVFFGLAAHDRR